MIVKPLAAFVAPDPHGDVEPLREMDSVTAKRLLVRVKLDVFAGDHQLGIHE